ncbi:MAG: ATP-binding protein [Methylophilaceae bacterium]|nr:ATP-binding protein [Methyloradius sp.]
MLKSLAKRLRHIFIYSMTGRFFLILIGGIIVCAAFALSLAAYEGKNMLYQVRLRHLTERVEQIVLTLELTPQTARKQVADITSKTGVRVDFSAPESIKLLQTEGYNPDTEASTALSKVLGNTKKVLAYQHTGLDCPVRPDGFKRNESSANLQSNSTSKCRIIFATLNDGTAIRIDVATPTESLPPPFRIDFLPYLGLFLLCVSLLAWFVANLATRPLRKLACAAHRVGQSLGQQADEEKLPEDTGPAEVREAAIAFNTMQSQIRRFVEERTYMLAAIAHDLQTPLTRLRLRLEKVSDAALRDKLINDLSVTLEMIKEGLELARSLNEGEPFEMLDLDSLIDTICNDATDAGLEVTQSGRVGVPVMARPNGLRRCISNLVENAVKYGQFAHVIVKREGQKVIISVIDGGDGIPEDQLLRVLEPFKRLEDSRSRDSGGTGLGLTIARNIAEKHRGSLRLRNICAGGLGLEAIVEMAIV